MPDSTCKTFQRYFQGMRYLRSSALIPAVFAFWGWRKLSKKCMAGINADERSSKNIKPLLPGQTTKNDGLPYGRQEP
jgi:hypothetical protein